MTSLVRFSPFEDSLDDLFRGFFVRPLAMESPSAIKIRMDVKEEDNAYLVQAEVPGVKKEDIQVAIDGNQVTIAAETRREKEGGDRVLRTERYFGKSARTFALAHDIEESAAEARYRDGVLELRLPKKSAPAAKRLTIQ